MSRGKYASHANTVTWIVGNGIYCEGEQVSIARIHFLSSQLLDPGYVTHAVFSLVNLPVLSV